MLIFLVWSVSPRRRFFLFFKSLFGFLEQQVSKQVSKPVSKQAKISKWLWVVGEFGFRASEMKVSQLLLESVDHYLTTSLLANLRGIVFSYE